MIAKEFGMPLEEVASWSWRKRELYAHALSAYNEFQQELAEEQREGMSGQNAIDSASTSTTTASQSDVHPALQKYDNVAHVRD